MGFDLKDYERVKARKKRFYDTFKDGRIVVEIIRSDANEAVFKAYLYKTAEDQKLSLALSTGHAQEFKGQGGPANRHAWLENCEESAIGRALDNGGFSGDLKCSREEITKVKVADGKAAEINDESKRKTNLINFLVKMLNEKGVDTSKLGKVVKSVFPDIGSFADMSIDQLTVLIDKLKTKTKEELALLAK